MPKKKKKARKQWLEAMAVAAFVLQAVEFGIKMMDSRRPDAGRKKPANV